MKPSRSPRFQASTCLSSTARTPAAESAAVLAPVASCARAGPAAPSKKTATAIVDLTWTRMRAPSIVADVERSGLALVDLVRADGAAVQAHRHLQRRSAQRAGVARRPGPSVDEDRVVRAREVEG